VEPLRRAIETIRKNLSGLKAGQWMILSLLGVILVMSLVLVAIWSGSGAMKELMPTATAEEQQRAIPVLQLHGIKTETRNGKLFVRDSDQIQALAAVYQSGQQPNNSVLVFDNLIKNQSWLNSKEQNRQAFQATLNNYLSSIISRFDGVRSANVFVDAPETVGIGQPTRAPKASITIFGKTSTPLPQSTIDAAAKMVAGSVSGLEVSRVSVTEGAGRPRKVAGEEELTAGTYRENAAALEKQFREKIYNLVQHIDGVVVEVTATLDVTKSRSQILKNLPVGQGSVSVPKKESSTTSSQTDAATGAEPGVRSNTQANISTGGGTGSKNEQNQDDTEFAVGIGTENKQVDDPGGMPTRLVATVNVPRGYIIAAIKSEAPPVEGDAKPVAPDPTAITTRFGLEEASIRKALEPHVKTRAPNGQMVEGEVVVTLVSGESFASGAGGSGGPGSLAGVGGTLGSILAMGGGLVEKALLGGLAVISVGMMLLMVRRAGKRLVVPTAEELVGVPPQLQAKDDLVGEADESETAIAGIELGEAEIRADKIREQVADLVKSSPEVAAKMLNRWISVEE
jgi:flagellar biosynthesis/type III secretory pathway M-ring protein FliF/YscJ